jgi:hypothetical protein
MPFPSHPFKVCSQCQTPAEPDAPLCEQCGRVFSAQSTSALSARPVSVSSDAPRNASGRRALIVAGLAFVAILSYAGYRYQTESPDHMEVSHPPAQYNAALGQHGTATPTRAASGPSRGAAMAPNAQFHH